MQLCDGSLATGVKAIGCGYNHSLIVLAINSEVRPLPSIRGSMDRCLRTGMGTPICSSRPSIKLNQQLLLTSISKRRCGRRA